MNAKVTLDTALLYSSSPLSHRNSSFPKVPSLSLTFRSSSHRLVTHLANSYTSLRALWKSSSPVPPTVLDAPHHT